MEIKFGTDGWRGIIGEDFTFANVRRCAQATAEHFMGTRGGDCQVIIGYDTRFASQRFAQAVAEVLAGNGLRVLLCSAASPTPVISFGVVQEKAAGAIIITASHNPAEWNGFKIKTADGASAPAEVERNVEDHLASRSNGDGVKRVALEEGLNRGGIRYIDIRPSYAARMAELVDLESIRKAGLNLVVDSMFGAGADYFRGILAGGGTRVVEIHAEPNPLFPGIKQPEPIGPNLAQLCDLVKQTKADVGLATDGDADRIGVVTEKGEPMTALQLFALLALYLLEIRGERGAIVKTLTTTSMLHKLGQIFGVPVYETKVGFKHVAPIMLEQDALIGGEESSGFGFRGHIPERDGILAGLLLLDFMIRTGKKPAELLDYLYRKVGPHHYHRQDVVLPAERRTVIIEGLKAKVPTRLAGIQVTEVATTDGYHFRLADGSWLLMRFSGTEPLMRVYAESASLDQAEKLIAEALRVVGI